mmetsp:Transcript_5857/g.10755  ORF Transcript_5857/g.10755 Transcript_5857/m.10755 type:complete len:376 (+) Transcript_5857:659-1786(+)
MCALIGHLSDIPFPCHPGSDTERTCFKARVSKYEGGTRHRSRCDGVGVFDSSAGREIRALQPAVHGEEAEGGGSKCNLHGAGVPTSVPFQSLWPAACPVQACPRFQNERTVFQTCDAPHSHLWIRFDFHVAVVRLLRVLELPIARGGTHDVRFALDSSRGAVPRLQSPKGEKEAPASRGHPAAFGGTLERVCRHLWKRGRDLLLGEVHDEPDCRRGRLSAVHEGPAAHGTSRHLGNGGLHECLHCPHRGRVWPACAAGHALPRKHGDAPRPPGERTGIAWPQASRLHHDHRGHHEIPWEAARVLLLSFLGRDAFHFELKVHGKLGERLQFRSDFLLSLHGGDNCSAVELARLHVHRHQQGFEGGEDGGLGKLLHL